MKIRDTKFNYDYIPLEITKEQTELSNDFGDRYAEDMHQHYSKTRNQNDLENIARQCKESKAFEFMVYNYAREVAPLAAPDIKIYPKNQKSFAADLTLEVQGIKCALHVKCQAYSTVYSSNKISWGFQIYDQLYHSPRANDFIVAGLYCSPTEGRLLLKERANILMPLAQDPLLWKFQGQKKFIYLTTIQKAGIDTLPGSYYEHNISNVI